MKRAGTTHVGATSGLDLTHAPSSRQTLLDMDAHNYWTSSYEKTTVRLALTPRALYRVRWQHTLADLHAPRHDEGHRT